MKSARYKAARGKGGFVRAEWWEAAEIAAAAHVHTIKKYGPDRVAGFSPIPAMSMVSHAVGARFISLIGGSMLSFYDWYADLPVASPQVFGDQTDVPESADWFDAGYLIMWGSNVPVTRTPDAHYMTEARYRGQKVIVVSPDYADNTKFADEWLPARPGTDAALAMAMGHVILKEFFVERTTAYFTDYVKKYTDLPFLVTLNDDGIPGKFLTAADLGDTERGRRSPRRCCWTRDGKPVVPNGSLGHRFTASGEGKWNLDLHGVDPMLTLHGPDGDVAAVRVPPVRRRRQGRADTWRTDENRCRTDGSRRCSTCCSPSTACTATGLPGDWPTGYDDASAAVHAGVAGADHRRAGEGGRADRA